MEDDQIIGLYWERSEAAISETAKKYGRYCRRIAFNILQNDTDSEECVNDAYLRAWNVIPPHRPNSLSAYLGKITRNLSLNRYRHNTAQKRGLWQTSAILDELEDCVPAPGDVEQIVDDIVLVEVLNRFLAALPEDSRKVFMRRYWYFNSVKEIAKGFGMSESRVKMTLLRARNSLKAQLEKEGITL